jgi:hypothetical protein
MATIEHHYVNGEEVDPTEIDSLDVQKVSAVGAPAHDQPFLLLKSAAQPASTWRSVPFEQWDDNTIAACASDTTISKAAKNQIADRLEAVNKENPVKKKKITKAVERSLNKSLYGGDNASKGTAPAGTVGTSDPQDGEPETDEMLRIVCKAEKSDPDNPALKVLRDPAASDEAKRIAYTLLKEGNGGDVNPQITSQHDANDVNSVLQPGDIAKMKIEWQAETDFARKAELGERLTFETLRALHHTPSRAVKSAVDNTDDPAPIAKLRELIKDPDLDPAVKMQAGEVITRHDLAKSAYTDSQEATNRLVAETQARVTANPQSASGGTSGVAGGVQSVSGTVTHPQLASTGKIEPEPAAVLGQRESELAEVQKETKSGSITDREVDLRNEVTKLRLQLTHV